MSGTPLGTPLNVGAVGTVDMYEAAVPAVLDQGVIVDGAYFYAYDVERPALVLTPACDLEQNKADLVLVCAVVGAWEMIRGLLDRDWKKYVPDPGQTLSAGKRGDLANRIRDLITQRLGRYHWLSPLPGGTEPQVADFQWLASLPKVEIEAGRIIAQLRSPYREQVPARYAAYMGRIGVPDFTNPQVEAWIDGAIAAVLGQ